MERNNKGQFLKGQKNRKYTPILGKRYGKLTIIDENITIKDDKVHFHLECDCGNKCCIRAYFLESNRQSTCASCSRRNSYNKCVSEGKRTGFCKSTHEGVGDFTKSCFSYIKRNSSRRGFEWDKDLTIEYLWNLLKVQNFKCVYSGLEIQLTTKRKSSNVDFEFMTASLDRINNDIGYVIGNIQWVHKDVNRMKWAFTEQRFLEICNLISKNYKL